MCKSRFPSDANVAMSVSAISTTYIVIRVGFIVFKG